MYKAMHGGQQTALDRLEAEGLFKVVDTLKRKWKVEISGDMFTATSSDQMDGGSDKEIRYDRNTGDLTRYGNNGLE